jgi:hypothetical protein
MASSILKAVWLPNNPGYIKSPSNEQNLGAEQNSKNFESMSSNSSNKNATENMSDSNEYFQKVKAIEILATFFAFLQLGNSVIIYEVSYENEDGEHDSFLSQCLAVSTLTSIGLTVSIILRHITHLKWK